MAVGDHQARRPQPARLEIPQQRRPALGRLPIPTLHREHDLAPVAQRRDQHQDRRLVLLQSRLDVDAIGPEVHGLKLVHPAVLPRLVLHLPPGLQPRDRRRRQRRPRPQQPPQGQVEVAVGQPMQVQLGQELADLLGAPLEQRQQLTLEARLQPPHPRPLHRDRPAHQTEPPRLAPPVAVPRRRVHPRPPRIPLPAQDVLDLLLQHLLQPPPDPLPGVRLQRLPPRP